MSRQLRVLVMSTPVGPIGSGIGGGVEMTIRAIASGLVALGHRVEVVAPDGSAAVGDVTHRVVGTAQPSVQLVDRSTRVPSPVGSVLANMWNLVRSRCTDFDVVLNLAYDELPFREAPDLARPVAHLVSMGSLTDAMDRVIDDTLRLAPWSVAMHSRAQAATFPRGTAATMIGSGVDVEDCPFVESPHADGRIGFVGRISAEKGLRDAVEACVQARRPLHVWGYRQDENAWIDAIADAPPHSVTYRGFVTTEILRSQLGECAALVMAPKWTEAFGNVAIEAMACGVPVVSYRRGGPAEIVVDGETGRLVAPDDVPGLAAALCDLGSLSRHACRRRAETHFSTQAFARRVEAWLQGVCGRFGRVDFSGTPLSF